MLGMVAGTAALGGLAAGQPAGAQSPQPGGVNRNSAPSQLRITDMRAIRIASNFDYPIIRIDTNQGVYGSVTQAMKAWRWCSNRILWAGTP
jgi:hypothetical protein